MKIIETFPFFNELDLLELHLNTTTEYVDRYLITESRFSHSGEEKPLFLSDNLNRFKEHAEKIEIQVIDSFPKGVTLFEADWYQRDSAKPLLDKLLVDGDILIYGDVDEVPRPSAIHNALNGLRSTDRYEVAHLAQDLFFYYLNFQEISGTLLSFMGEYEGVTRKSWLGTTVNRWEACKRQSPTSLRNPERKQSGFRVPFGGWHFSWVGSSEPTDLKSRVSRKLQNTAHQEFASPLNRLLLDRRLRKGKDLVGRRSARFRRQENLGFLPEYVLGNLDKFDHLILK